MKITVRKFKSLREASEADRAYYKSLTPEERLDILLELVRPEQEEHYATGKGFARVYRIVPLERS